MDKEIPVAGLHPSTNNMEVWEEDNPMAGQEQEIKALKPLVNHLQLLPWLQPPPAAAATPKKVVVAGATGQTGRRILERLAQKGA